MIQHNIVKYSDPLAYEMELLGKRRRRTTRRRKRRRRRRK